MQRRDPLSPYVALAITLAVSGVLAASLLVRRPASLWPTRASAWFGIAAGGDVRFDRPAR